MSEYKVALIGNPNCGKSTLFNVLTGAQQTVGNWPGVTVEHKVGYVKLAKDDLHIIDLPGIYALIGDDTMAGVDENIARDSLLNGGIDLVVNVVDAEHIERNLYLTLQLLELGVPCVIALNMMDVMQRQGVRVDVSEMSVALGCPVVPIVASRGEGRTNLLNTVLTRVQQVKTQSSPLAWPRLVKQAVEDIERVLVDISEPAYALRLLEQDRALWAKLDTKQHEKISAIAARLQGESGEAPDLLIADVRYDFIHRLTETCFERRGRIRCRLTAMFDSVLLHRVFAIPSFLLIMYAMFVFSINLGGAFQDFFDLSSQALFVDGVAVWLNSLHAPHWLITLLAYGVGRGINTTVTFVPVIAAMFFALAFLERSGYMARAAFVMDKVMQRIGLPGKAFVPMIIGFGCNVPAIMATRTLESHRDRVLTVLMSPFMACSARLAIFAVFAAAFFPQGGQNVVFALYLLGIVMAILTGFVVRRYLLPGDVTPFVMELPPYRLPRVRDMVLTMWQRLQRFLTRASRMIIPICIILSILHHVTLTDGYSLLETLGRALTPLLAPLGISRDNWPATVGLFTGMLAKEVVIGTLNMLYGQAGIVETFPTTFALGKHLLAAWHTIPENLAALPHALVNPVLASAPGDELSTTANRMIQQAFGGTAAAFSYLVFVLLYIPCVSTAAVIRRELNASWMWFSVLWSLALAYIVAVICYQVATFGIHPWSASAWVVTMVLATAMGTWLLKHLKGYREVASS